MSEHDHGHIAVSKAKLVLLTVFKGENERAVLQVSHQKDCDTYDKIWNEVGKQLGKKRKPNDSGRLPKKPPTDLSVYLLDEDVTFVIELHETTRAAFGPGPHPIMILPSMLGRELLSEVALIYKDASGQVIRLTQNNIPHEYSAIPPGAALSFRCSRSKMIAVWIANVINAGHGNPQKINIRVPFFLNLFDKATGKPVWTYGTDYHPELKDGHDHDKGPIDDLVHGGIHPDSVTQFFYYPE